VVEAVRCETASQIKRWTWDWIKRHDTDKKAYIELYKLVINATQVRD
jgi:hypothetical protein